MKETAGRSIEDGSGRGWWTPERIGRWGSRLLRLLGATWRIRILGEEREAALGRSGQPPLYAFWHGKLLTLAYTHRGRGIAVLISQHRDGDRIARIIENMGYATVRGSTTRGGLRAVMELAREASRGRTIAVTPDGPRGPFETLQPGLLMIAQRSQAPVVAMGVAAHPSTRLGSWDAFLVAHPGARCLVSVAPAFRVPADVPPAEAVERFTEPVRAFIKANDDHAHRQLLRWIGGASELEPFRAPVPAGLVPVILHREMDAHAVGL